MGGDRAIERFEFAPGGEDLDRRGERLDLDHGSLRREMVIVTVTYPLSARGLTFAGEARCAFGCPGEL